MHYLPAYRAYFHSQARYAILYGGAGSGKSVTAAQKAILQCLLFPGASILCIRKYRTSLRHSVFELLKNQLQTSGRAHQVITSVTNLTFQFPNGSQIRCLGLDDPEKIKSIQGISSVWVEEATELREQDFAQLELRVRGRTPGYKQFTLSFNPTDQSHWLHKRFFQTQSHNQPTTSKEGTPSPEGGRGRGLGAETEGTQLHLTQPQNTNIFTLHTTYLQNTELDQAYRHHLTQVLRADENLYRIYTLGQWGHLRKGGEFYKAFSMATHALPCTYDPELPLHISFDFNLHPYMTCTVWQLNGSEAKQIGELCLASPNNTTQALCRELLRQYPNPTSGCYIYGDPSGSHASPLTDARTTHYNIIQQELRDWHPRMRVAPSAPGVARRALFLNAALAGAIENVSIRIDTTCLNTLADYQNLQEAPDGTKLKSTAKDAQTGIRSQALGHCSDANDYLLCEAFKREMRRFERAGRPLMAPVMGRERRVW